MKAFTGRAVVLAAAVLARGANVDGQPTYRERVDVPRIVVDVRALDGQSNSILNLAARDFTVRIDGKPALVESATWVEDAPMPAQGLEASADATRDASRWLVVVVQRKPDLSEMDGLQRIRDDLLSFIDRQAEGTNIAVLSFDTRLHQWLDFTRDREPLRQVFGQSLFTSRPPRDVAIHFGTGTLPESDIRTQTSLEEGLASIALLLSELPGLKNLLLIGHGLGTWVPRLGLVELAPNYPALLEAFRRARTSVFCIDLTRADYHPRQEGLVQVASDSGGLYWQSHIFTRAPFERLGRVLSGHYTLLVVPPELRKGDRSLRVSLKGRKGQVLVARRYVVE